MTTLRQHIDEIACYPPCANVSPRRLATMFGLAETERTHITCQIRTWNGDSHLYLLGAEGLLAQGYELYVFRHTRITRDRRRYRGWRRYHDNRHARLDDDGMVQFLGDRTQQYETPSPLAAQLFPAAYICGGTAVIPFGSHCVKFDAGQRHFRFALAFSKPQEANAPFDFTRLVTNMAEFRVVALRDDTRERADGIPLEFQYAL